MDEELGRSIELNRPKALLSRPPLAIYVLICLMAYDKRRNRRCMLPVALLNYHNNIVYLQEAYEWHCVHKVLPDVPELSPPFPQQNLALVDLVDRPHFAVLRLVHEDGLVDVLACYLASNIEGVEGGD